LAAAPAVGGVIGAAGPGEVGGDAVADPERGINRVREVVGDGSSPADNLTRGVDADGGDPIGAEEEGVEIGDNTAAVKKSMRLLYPRPAARKGIVTFPSQSGASGCCLRSS
jgi:hypothetical protein